MFHLLKRSVPVIAAIGLSLAGFAQKSTAVPKNWHLLDPKDDGFYGISLNKAYEAVKGRKAQTVVVAVIDSGIDTLHEDLKNVLWINPKEIPGNGTDDDKNGYADDVHGWNFIGGKDGRNVKEDSYEVTRVYHRYKKQFQNVTDPSTLSKEDQETYRMWKKAEKQVAGKTDSGNSLDLLFLRRAVQATVKHDSILRKAMDKERYTGNDLEAFAPTTEEAKKARSALLYLFSANNIMDMTNTAFLAGFQEQLASEERKAEAADKAPKNYRGEIVKDNESDINDRFYGNNDVMANTPEHGTHVAGIIAADRKNSIGVNGIADNVRIMAIRAVPDGDEHDKDVALAIRYAVDNGAKIINMSFGKSFSPEKSWVDEAVKYAESKNVLLVHAAGNDAANVDTVENFPNPVFKGSKIKASNWITVGASGDPKIGGLIAGFSNYGKNEVDVFAPGHQIYSTLPSQTGDNAYGSHSGTSMASPVVAGTAAFILSYFPNLTAQQLKYVIENSAVKPTVKAVDPGTGKPVSLSELSKTGGVINAYEAVKLASTLGTKTTHPVKKAPAKKPAPAKAF